MVIIVFLLLVLASAEVGFMDVIRKSYQVKNGSGAISTAVFFFVAMTIMAGCCFVMSPPVGYNGIIVSLALVYGFVSTVIAILCLVGTAWGNLSVIIICASLGTLVIPSLYGIIMFPEENKLTLLKVIGFICAFVIIFMNFISEKKKDSGKSGIKYKLACVVVFLLQGSALIIFSAVNKLKIDDFKFMGMSCLLSAVMMLMWICFAGIKNKGQTFKQIKEIGTMKNTLMITGYALFAVTSEIISLYCAGKMPLIFQSPVSFAVPIIIVSVFDYFMYREKFTKNQIIQIMLAVICCAMFLIG